MAKAIEKPRIIAFEVTGRCRFNCRHCRASAGIGADSQDLKTSQCKRIIRRVGDYIEGEGRAVLILTGGEPMERGDICELVACGRGRGFRVVLATCGYLLDEDSLEQLKEAGIAALSFSLDGASAQTNDRLKQTSGAFEAVVRATRIAKEAGIEFQINSTISKLNMGEVFGIADAAERLGAKCFNPFVLVPMGRGEEMADEILDPLEYEVLLNELLRVKMESGIEVRVTCAPAVARIVRQKRFAQLTEDVSGCMAGRGFAFISRRGDVQTCGFLDISAGNLVENNYNFGKIWRQSAFLGDIRDLSKYNGTCGSCEYLSVCGGCRARAFAVCGDYLGEDPVCSYQTRRKK